MKCIVKNLFAGALTAAILSSSCMMFTMAASPRGNADLVFTHGHDNHYNTAYAITQKTSNMDFSYIGAKAVLNYSNGTKYETPQIINDYMVVKAETDRQHFKKGTSFCYYYRDGRQVHQSTAPMPFNWGW